MKFAHLADLHLGISVNGFSMIEDQRYILQQVLSICGKKKVDCLLLAGDVYDRAVPSAEASALFSDFLTQAVRQHMAVYSIPGNHDSGMRLSFGADLFQAVDVHVVGNFNGAVKVIPVTDYYGTINIWLLPFVRLLELNRYAEEPADNLTMAMKKILTPDPSERNVILSHAFVTGVKVNENGSEHLEVGGSDAVSWQIYEDFDYAALGHIHSPQAVGKETIRYSGSPLAYSLAEYKEPKSMPIVELKEKGHTELSLEPLVPLHAIQRKKGTYAELMKQGTGSEDYFYLTLTDEQDIPDAISYLRQEYPHIMRLDYDNARTRALLDTTPLAKTEMRDPADLFDSFYQMRNNRELNAKQKEYLQKAVKTVWEEEE